MNDNAIKKQFLNRYRLNKRKEKEILLELEALETEYGLHSPRFDDMPHGSGGGDLSDFAVRYDKIYTRLLRLASESLEYYREISDAIEASPCNETENALLRYRYIMGHTWERIAEEMELTERWIYAIHGRALIKFKLPAGKAL